MIFEFLTVDYDPCPLGEQPTFFGFSCPKRADHMCTGLMIVDNPEGIKKTNRMWAWNGSRTRPTFSPSIDCLACSHGWIENGKWRDA